MSPIRDRLEPIIRNVDKDGKVCLRARHLSRVNRDRTVVSERRPRLRRGE